MKKNMGVAWWLIWILLGTLQMKRQRLHISNERHNGSGGQIGCSSQHLLQYLLLSKEGVY
jgi:hypothetical protein